MNVFGGIACVLALSGVALAEPVLFHDGTPQQGNSWTSGNFNAGGFTAVDFMGVSMNSAGDSFQSPVFQSFGNAGWDNFGNYGSTSTIAASSGPAFVSNSWQFQFAGNMSDPLNFDLYLFSGSTIEGVFNIDWNGSSFSISSGSASLTRGDFEMAVIPLPTAAAMALFGMAAVGSRRQRSVA